MSTSSRINELKLALAQRLLVMDGAMGTAIQNKNLGPNDFGGEEYEGCNEYLIITKPDVIKDIHQSYLQAGADIIETNTFGGTPVVLAEYHLAHEARRINKEGAALALEAALAESTPEKPRFVAGSMGPTTKTISVTGGITFEELANDYHIQASGLIEGGVDVLLLETSQDTLNVKAGLEGIDRAFAELGIQVPVAVQGTIEPMGTLLAGQDAEAFYTSLAHRDLLWIGINCATGANFMTDHIRTLSSLSKFPVACLPNAGMPDEDGNYNETPENMAETVGRFAESGWVNIVGGCCGTVSEHIKLLSEMAEGKTVRSVNEIPDSRVSGIESLLIDDDVRPVIVGERTNVLGSRQFRRLIKEGSFEEAAEVGRRQVRNGAHILDVCLQDPDRDESADVAEFLDLVTKKVKAPIMIDSTDASVIELALTKLQGKSIINSINLEDGEERFQSVVPLAKRYGASLVVGCIDDDKEQAQAITKERKLEVAIRSATLLTEKYGIPIEDIVFDPLVFPVGTGDENYVGSGAETIEGVRLIKKALPGVKTVLGISNVSFGLPAAGREVLNSVFLYHCVQAGLDMAIVNSEGMERYATIPEEERKLAEDLIWFSGEDPVAAFADHFREKAPKASSEERLNLPLDERLALAIIEGSKEGLAEDLDEALTGRTPLEIINGPLMDGMAEVGRQFNANQLIVAEVLQSAESMKFSVSHLEPHMEQADSAVKGKVVLATVKGDVHDIGKNLVEIILGNNGYQVINLGIKVPPEELISAVKEHKPDMVGLSGLLVKSAKMMVETAQDFSQAGITTPVLVGGAALSNRFTRLRIAPEYDGMVAYAPDAMSGLALANTIQDADERAQLITTFDEEVEEMLAADEASREGGSEPGEDVPPAQVRHDFDIPNPPDLRLHVINDHPLEDIFPLINPQMLYVRHLGYKGRFADDLESGVQSAIDLRDSVRNVEDLMLAQANIKANAVFKFFPANSDGQQILVHGSEDRKSSEKFYFGRQSQRDGLCLADYLLPQSSGQADYLGMFLVSIGTGVRKLAETLMADGQFLNSHILSALALESAEAFAELLHQQMRQMWGYGDKPGTTPQDLFRTQYRGKRFSFGYPACPRLEDQEQLFRLLDVSTNLDVELTEGFMMDPESSVSALVFHHPDAKYFNLSETDIERLEQLLSK
ncbi:MAG: methionine synthase [Chloroflexota bacterium]|jgi:5-methyltetrahydrofolate--homocysteine methyltransferase|nr:methionine synthase [Dehalococcoidia bacterium]MEE3012706.1 methionine synthase [Chloroflexota bacterium]